MHSAIVLLIVVGIAVAGYMLGRSRATSMADGGNYRYLHSLPGYHGAYVALMVFLPAAMLMALWLVLSPQVVQWMLESRLSDQMQGMTEARQSLLLSDVRNLAFGDIVSRTPDPALQQAADFFRGATQTSSFIMALAVVALAVAGLFYSRARLTKSFRARNTVERIIDVIMIVASCVAILTTLGIVLSLLFETIRFFGKVPVTEFLFGLKWSPQTALRADQVGSSGAFGAVPIFVGTFLITLIAMAVAVPVGLFSAIYMSEYASKRFRSFAKPALEVLAGIPTVVYGFFAALTVAPFIRDFGQSIGLDVASESALAAGGVMGIMIIPFVSSLSDDVINSVPQTLRDGAYALGATKAESIKQVVFPAALPGIVGAVLLAISRAVGETMIVVMAAGLAANLTLNPLEAVTTATVQIVTLLTGDQEFDSAKTLSAFALGLVLFIITLILNVVALGVVRKYREKYD